VHSRAAFRVPGFSIVALSLMFCEFLPRPFSNMYSHFGLFWLCPMKILHKIRFSVLLKFVSGEFLKAPTGKRDCRGNAQAIGFKGLGEGH
jgi:hypothetical protein